MRRDDDDLIGDVPANDIGETLSFRTADVHMIGGGVSIPWLMKAFRMGRATVEKKLVGCVPVGQGKHNTPLYDLPEAASYLVKPRVELNRMLKDLKPEDLPERLREGYWNSKLKQQRFEERAGNLWRTERVLATFSETLQEIRTKLMIVPDRVDREVGLTPEQVAALASVIDEVQDDIH
ncbi:DUF1441 family protein [Azospirillum doebereinerae]|uniref:DUF1441 family protein n=1 Tax=Azospirillum doebereinerae TaxID=92933 RepID=A0A3S0VEH1_9PROT|nr:DUF1441 family protein [Azospirillum doebereinerae]RUQ63907.1 DUF1441 family protein [Azospirillum doebereinerae]